MTNLEFYKDKLLEIADAGTVIAIVDGKPTDGCRDLKCEECDRCDKCTDADLLKWLLSEHTEETANYKICKTLKLMTRFSSALQVKIGIKDILQDMTQNKILCLLLIQVAHHGR